MEEKDELSKRLLQNSKVSSSSSAQSLWHQIWEEKKKLWVVAGPAIFSRFSTFGVSIISMAFMGHIGATELAGIQLSFFVKVRVANELGAGSASSAKFSICVVLTTSFTIGAVFFFVFLLLRGNVAYVFTQDQRVVTAVANLSPLLAFNILLNTLQPVFSGVAVGAGWQRLVAYINLGCYYLIGIPLGMVLGYELHLGVKGVWMVMIVGVTAQTMLLISITWKTDWDSQVVIAQARVRKWFLPTQPLELPSE